MSNWLYIGLYFVSVASVLIWFLILRKIRANRKQEQKDSNLFGKKVEIDKEWLKLQDISLRSPHGYITSIVRPNKKQIYVEVGNLGEIIRRVNGNIVYDDCTVSVPVNKLTLLEKGGEKLPRTEKKASYIMKMPRIFRYTIYAAIAVLIWKFVNNAETIMQFLMYTFVQQK